MQRYANPVFAPIDHDHILERVAGGNETEVYRTDDGRFVVKLKSDLGGKLADARDAAQAMRAAAEEFTACLGAGYTIPSQYVVAQDEHGLAHVLVLQPFLHGARPLHDLDYSAMADADRLSIIAQLHDIIRRSLVFYRATGSMPDLYGRTSSHADERKRLNTHAMLPRRVWSFVVERNLLRSHNLMWTADRRVVLVDYDFVRRSALYRRVYYAVRWMLFARDHALLARMKQAHAASVRAIV